MLSYKSWQGYTSKNIQRTDENQELEFTEEFEHENKNFRVVDIEVMFKSMGLDETANCASFRLTVLHSLAKVEKIYLNLLASYSQRKINCQ